MSIVNWHLAYEDTPASNALTITLTPLSSADGRVKNNIIIGSVRLGNTAGSTPGDFKIDAGTDEIWNETFVIGTDKALGNVLPVAGRAGENVVITADATTLSAGYLAVTYAEVTN